MFAYQARRGSVEVGFTDRHRGMGGGPSATLDLAEPPRSPRSPGCSASDRPGRVGVDGALAPDQRPVGDLDVVVRALTSTDDPAGGLATVVRMHQVHGAHVHVVDGDSVGRDSTSPPVADGLVTRLPGVVLLVRVADCVPVLLADVTRGVVGAAHAGRAGLEAGVVPATVERMRKMGAEEVLAWVGPHICGRCYEVPAELRARVAAAVPQSFTETSWGTPALDVGAGVFAQLRQAGAEVVDASRCTLEDSALHSYRRDGAAAGRLGGLVWMRR